MRNVGLTRVVVGIESGVISQEGMLMKLKGEYGHIMS